MRQITIFKNIKATSSGYHRDVPFVLDRIKKGTSKELLEKIRLEPEKKKRDELKQFLPSICFSGTFNNRSKSGIIEHSGLICLDFDNFDNDELLQTWRDTLTANEFIYSVFTSPSGNGLKALVKIPYEIENHKAYHDSLMNHFDSPYFDKNTHDISRVCYESYDPNIHINNDSKIWTRRKIDDNEELGTNIPTLAVTSESRIVENLLTWFNKKYNMSKGERNSNLFILASAFNDFGVNKNEAENILLRFESGDFDTREIQSVVNSAYRNTSSFNTKFFEDKQTKDKIEKMIKSGRTIKEIKEDFKDISEQSITNTVKHVQQNIAEEEFWEINDKGNVALLPHRYKKFLEGNHFAKYYPTISDNFIFIKKEGNKIEEISSSYIKDFVLNYVSDFVKHGYEPYNYLANATKYFKEDYLSFLSPIDLKIQEDTADTCYLYFKNCAVAVTKSEVKKIDYVDLDGFVWKKHVIDRDYELSDYKGCDFDKFILRVAGSEEKRAIMIVSIIGYLLHSYKTSANNKAVIINDEIISENPNGGSGKGIFCNAIGHMKRIGVIDGKQFNFEKSFAYQTVGADTQVLVFDDVKKNFAFENLFSLITEGITIEKKNKDAFKIPVNRSPKLIITTNYTIGGVGGSFERRKIELEFSSYFNSKHTPLDEFGRMLFDEWDSKEWSRFDNYMIQCLQLYLMGGIFLAEYKNLEQRKFIQETSFEFTEWVQEDNGLPCNERLIKKHKYNEFIELYPDFRKWLTQKRFSIWIESWAKFQKLDTKKGQNGAERWIAIIDKTKPKWEFI